MIPLLAASEKGTGQAESPSESSVEMWFGTWLSNRVEVIWKDPLQRVIAP